MVRNAVLVALLLAGGLRAHPPGGFACGPYHDLRPPLHAPARMNARSPLRDWKTAHFERAFERLCRCWADLGSPRAECEALYLQDLERECQLAYGGSPWEARALVRCKLVASLHHRRAVEAGPAAWRDAQDEARYLETPRESVRRQRSLKWKVGYPELVDPEPPRPPSSAR